jgi:hypothetical protein
MITVDSYLRIKPPSGFKAPVYSRSKDEIAFDVIIKKLLSLSFQKYICQDYKNVLLSYEMNYSTIQGSCKNYKPAGCRGSSLAEISEFDYMA